MQSDQINELMTALSKAQGIMKPAIKDSTNPHFKSSYADLASVWEACRDALSKNGLAITQTMDLLGDKQVLVTMLGHISGQFMKSVIALPIQRPGSQELGSCLSYCRRYALAAIVGVYQDDDDGEKAQTPYRENGYKSSVKSSLTSDQVATLKKLSSSVSDKDYMKQLNEYLKVGNILDLDPKDYERAIRSLERKIKEDEGKDGSSEVA